ncbi:hypothetical protein [Aurantimonas sp. VKM B-3413]|uniref:hypothetical protein n=1 Tax=Aurantimonas sp. VKM B-3413 TaxID=2779401 RepID=UPI00351D70B5
MASRFLPALASGFLFVLAGCSVTDIAPSAAAEPQGNVPGWLAAHIGDEDGEISDVVLQRARALYQRKTREGRIDNGCYFAMDATRPSVSPNGERGRRFYMICEGQHTFRAMSSGYGSGRKLAGVVDFSNGQQCAQNFGNAMDSSLTTGGGYVTAETRDSFKGYHRSASGKDVPFVRSFVQFEGEGATANARERVIGGHQATLVRAQCRRLSPGDQYADDEGYVAFGKLVDYAAGRSNGCTSWSAAENDVILSTVKNDPTTVYIYPEARDIEAVSQAVASGRSPSEAGSYWNAMCLKAIGKPRYWPASTLKPLIARFKASQPVRPTAPLPICSQP